MIAIIAGTGNLPSKACKSLLTKNKDFFVISLFPQDNFEEIKKTVPKAIPIIQEQFYKVSTIISILKKHNTKEVLFIGKVDKQNLLKKFKLDWLAIKYLASLATKSDMMIMNKIEKELQRQNIEILPQDSILESLIVPPGILTGNITKELKQSIDMGIELAEKISLFDIGQTVVIKDKMVLAIEAIEGTDACIKRGINLGKNNIIVCKAAHRNQNKKFDLPTIGSATLEDIKKGEIKAIAWQSSQTIIADQERFINRAKELKITLISI